MAMRDDFAVFILTNNRPDKVITYNTLRKQNYTGKIYLLVDNEDKTVDQYRERYGDEVIVFDKAKVAEYVDRGDNQPHFRGVVFARNAIFDIARGLGLKYFLELDDDYTHFAYKFRSDLTYYERKCWRLDDLFEALLDYYISTPAVTLAMAQNGDYIGGSESGYGKELRLHRKAMNSFFCDVDRPFKFMGRINEDVNAYTWLGRMGKLFLTVPNVSLAQKTTQQNSGGLTELYLDTGTYVKSFYTVLYAPSCTKVAEMGDKHKRIHHRISWNNAVPKILSEEWRAN